MILVTGASGTIGGHVVRLLADRGVPFRAMSRNPVDLPNAVRADFTDPVSLTAAVAGVDAVFLVTVPPVPSAEHDIALVDAATAAGVRKIVKLSAIGSGEPFEGATVGAWHVEAEEAIAASGLAWTVLRPPSFASNFLRYQAMIAEGDQIPNVFGTARQPIVDPRDVAAVAVATLLDSTHDGRRYDVTGPELLTFDDQAAVLERVLGRPVRTVDVGLRPQLEAAGMPAEAIAQVSLGTSWAGAGGAEYVTEHVNRILGRPPGTFEQWAIDHRAMFNRMR
ncbi:NAD(P)H-binding protein [Actinophytocola sp. NPDC049390]|uniref:NAD(P)H-binding protein n=1 Tax=Actinophytocola sp. NPDC049390 TaxID=3363894 RepID=UPI00379D74B6